MRPIRHVIWDFNGTLLDDVDHCVETLNSVLEDHAIAPVSRGAYRERFRFPVQAFYTDLGLALDEEDFEALSITYIERYERGVGKLAPPRDAIEVMMAVARRGIGQSVLSAMEQALLDRMLRALGLRDYLQAVRGLDHFRATSKVELGAALVAELGVPAGEMLLVGDTLHDHETARAIGCRCILYAHGHQTPERLRATGAEVVESLSEVVRRLDAAALAHGSPR